MAKVKIPKKVAGVKLPKQLRKQAKKALKLTGSPAARELAMAGLALAAQRMIAAAGARQGQRKAGADLLDAAGRQGVRGTLAALNLGEVVRAAAVEGARRFLEGFEEGAKPAPLPKAKRRKTS